MIVDHAGGLHEGVDDGAADEAEAALLHVFGNIVRYFCCCLYVFKFLDLVNYWFATNKTPDVFVETTKLFLHGNECLRVRDCAVHFQTVTNDAGVL